MDNVGSEFETSKSMKLSNLILLVLLLQQSFAIDLNNGLVSYWKLDEASGTRADSHGANTLTDNNTVTQGVGKISNAALFTAVNSEFLSAADSASLDFTTAFTFSAWIYGDDLTVNAAIASKWNYSSAGGWAIQLGSVNVSIIRVFIASGPTDGGDNWVDFDAGLTSDVWHHVVVVYDGSQLAANRVKLYVNGVNIASFASAGTPADTLQNNAVALRIGDFQGLSRFWQGRIDEVAMWNKVLTATEITRLYDSGDGEDYPLPAHVYILDGGSGAGVAWSDALDDLPATKVRENTYYVGDGTYGGETFSTATSGTSVITILKATVADHGTDTGWVSTMGDGVATFNGQISFTTSYWEFNGQVGGGPGSFTSGHGFKVIQSSCAPVIHTTNGADINDFVIAHVELQGDLDNSCGGSSGQDAFAFAGNDNLTVSYVYSHSMGRTHFWTWGESENITIEYSQFAEHVSSAGVHSEVGAFDGIDNLIVRYSVFVHVEGTGGLIIAGNNASIYGNIFYQPAGVTWEHGNGVIGTWTVSTLTNCKVYNNSFILIVGSGIPVFGELFTAPTTGNVVKNNLLYAIDSEIGGLGAGGLFPTHTHNHYVDTTPPGSGSDNTTASGDPFVDYVNLNFALTADTTAGDSAVSSVYRTDMFGNTGTTRGAIQFVGGGGTSGGGGLNVPSKIKTGGRRR